LRFFIRALGLGINRTQCRVCYLVDAVVPFELPRIVFGECDKRLFNLFRVVFASTRFYNINCSSIDDAPNRFRLYLLASITGTQPSGTGTLNAPQAVHDFAQSDASLRVTP